MTLDKVLEFSVSVSPPPEEENFVKNSEQSGNLPYSPASLPLFHGCWQKTQDSQVRGKGSIIPSTADDMNFMFELVPLILQDPQGAAMQNQVDAAHVGHLYHS